MLVSIRAAWESFRSNLFAVPMIFLIVAAVGAQLMLYVDVELRGGPVALPLILRSTVDSARTLLSTVATATITVAGIAFSVSLLLFQLASSQFSPRVLHGLFRDPFTKRVLGLVVGTFTYCLLVLRAVRGEVEGGGAAIVPNVSVVVALLLGIGSILAIVAFINHTAHSMHATEIIQRITGEVRAQIRRLADAPDERDDREHDASNIPTPPDDAFIVPATTDGWVQQVDVHNLLDATDHGGTIRLETFPGDFVPKGAALCSIWPPPRNDEHAAKEAREAIRLGSTRTMQQDLGFGIRQLVDIALRALSTGINDPTTATEVISHLAGVMRDLLVRELPPTHVEDDHGRQLFRPRELDHERYVELTFAQIRRSGASQPAVARHLIDALGPLAEYVEDAGFPDRAAAVREQARLVLAEAESADVLEEDLRMLRERAQAFALVER